MNGTPTHHTSAWYNFHHETIKNENIGDFLEAQWLGLCASIAGGPGLISNQGTQIPCGQNNFFFFKANIRTGRVTDHSWN